MASLRRAAERSLQTVGDQEATEGRALEIAQAGPLKRIGLTAIDALAHCSPDSMAKALGIDRNLPELEVLDAGWNSTVYRLDHETVLKVIDQSVYLTRRKRERAASQMRDEHAAFIEFVGSPVLPHEVDIGPDPVEQTSSAIRITQPYRAVDFLKLDEEDAGNIPALAQRLDKADEAYPGVLDEIDSVLHASRALYEDRGLSTDLIGINNMGVETSSGSFIIVDGQPLTGGQHSAQARINQCFDNLEAALAIAA